MREGRAGHGEESRVKEKAREERIHLCSISISMEHEPRVLSSELDDTVHF